MDSYPQFVIKDLNELLNEKSSWDFTLESNTVPQYLVFDFSQMTNAHKNNTKSAYMVIDGKVLDANNQVLMYWDTKSFTNNNNSRMNNIFGSPSTITVWNSDLSNLTNSDHMFFNCTKLTTFTSDLSSLILGGRMFANCTSLTSFNVDLSNLTDGYQMFDGCTSLTSFNGDLSSLKQANNMFSGTALTSFNIDLSNLRHGNWLFYRSALTSFYSDLSSLTQGFWMFWICKLDADSLKNIIHTINDLSDDTDDGTDYWGQIYIGLGYTNTDDSKLAIAKHCSCDSWEELNQKFSDKGWTVAWGWYGSQSASNILNLLDDNETPSTIIWGKLVEVTDEEEYYEYVLEEDPSKHYIIDWFHETNGSTEGYQQFGSLLEACGYFGVIPKEYAENQ